MKRLFAIIATLFLATFFLGGTASATSNGQGEHVPVNVCHATSSDTNPYVFITVDDDSTKLQGHLAHRNEPNKTWKSDGSWNGVEHLAGDPKADKIETYTDSEGVTHELDGAFTDCGSDTTEPPKPVKTQAYVDFFDPTCENPKAGILSEYNTEQVTATLEGTVAPGETVTLTFEARPGFKVVPKSVWTHTYGEVPDKCDKTDPPKDPNPPKDPPNHSNPGNPDKPSEPSEPTLPHTGANLGLSLLGSGLVGAGGLLLWATRRKLTGI